MIKKGMLAAKLKNIHLLNKINLTCDSNNGKLLQIDENYVFEQDAQNLINTLRMILTPVIKQGQHKYYMVDKKLSDLTKEEEDAIVNCADEIIAVIEKHASTLPVFSKVKSIDYDKFHANEKKYSTKRKKEMVASGKFVESQILPGYLEKASITNS